VLTLTASTRSAAARFRNTSDEQAVVAVLIESMPALACRLRDAALPHRYRSTATTSGGDALNAELRCISRVVVHPRWRGLGLAVRLVKAALDTATTRYTEAIAAMGAVHPFFEKAGMTAYRRSPTECDARLTAALARAGVAPINLALLEETWGRITRLPPPTRNWLLAEIRRWHARTHRGTHGRAVDERTILIAARQRLLCEPVYYLHRNSIA
jgi:GNAT superfamily N-acetyltransferase